MPKVIYQAIQKPYVEGRDTHVVGHFKHRRDAELISSTGVGADANGGTLGAVKNVTVYGSVEDFIANNEDWGEKVAKALSPEREEQIRREALARLTPLQKKVLGLSD